MKIIFISVVPHVSGPYSFYKNLKKGLKQYGWDVIGLTLNGKNEIDGFLNIFSETQEEVNNKLILLLKEHKVDIFMPISYTEFHNAIPYLKQVTKIVKRATVL